MRLTQVAALLLLAVAARAADAGSAARRHPSEYELLRQIPKDRLRLLMWDAPDTHGFMGSNRQAGRWLEAGTQRGSCRSVIFAVVQGDLAAADDAWRGIEVTFAHQRPDGGFEAGVRPNGESTLPLGAAVETAYFFLQELGRAILVIRESPHLAHFQDRITALEPKIRRAMAFVAAGHDTILTNSGHAVNRVIIAAKAYGLCGLVLQDESLVASSRKLVAFALTRRDADGVFLEKGGRDSSYNAVSILFGQVLALHVPLPDFETALEKAVAWQLTRILDTGEVNVSGNTRTGVGKEKSIFGQPKNVNYSEVVQALTLYGLARQDKAALAAADRVTAYWQSGGRSPR